MTPSLYRWTLSIFGLMALSAIVLPTTVLWATVLTAAVLPATVAAAAEDTTWQSKIDPWVAETLHETGTAEFLVVLEAQADLAGARELRGKRARGEYVFQRLRQTAAATQPAVLAELDAHGTKTRPFWIANMIWVRGDAATAEAMARRPDVRGVRANPRVQMETPFVDSPGEATEGGCLPAGIADGGGLCGADSTEPCDDFGHGTHTMVGQAGTAILGMAPGARWIGCRNNLRCLAVCGRHDVERRDRRLFEPRAGRGRRLRPTQARRVRTGIRNLLDRTR